MRRLVVVGMLVAVLVLLAGCRRSLSDTAPAASGLDIRAAEAKIAEDPTVHPSAMDERLVGLEMSVKEDRERLLALSEELKQRMGGMQKELATLMQAQGDVSRSVKSLEIRFLSLQGMTDARNFWRAYSLLFLGAIVTVVLCTDPQRTVLGWLRQGGRAVLRPFRRYYTSSSLQNEQELKDKIAKHATACISSDGVDSRDNNSGES